MRGLKPARAAHRVQRGKVVHQPAHAPQLIVGHVGEVAMAQQLITRGGDAVHPAVVLVVGTNTGALLGPGRRRQHRALLAEHVTGGVGGLTR